MASAETPERTEKVETADATGEAPAGAASTAPPPLTSVTAEDAAAAPPAAGQAAEPAITVDPQYDEDDGDSAIGGVNSTASLSSSILAYRQIHGRTFQNYSGAEYWGPNDDRQSESLDLAHHMLYLAYDNRLALAPIGDNPQRVLDIGTGTGIWAIDFADEHPSAEVIGTDLSPIQPQWLPPNCKFEIDDAEKEWTWPENHFDYIHIRCLLGSIVDWQKLFQQAYRSLKPGGWIEHVDFSVHTTTDDVPGFGPDHIWVQWAKMFTDAGVIMQREYDVIEKSRGWLENAGFVNIEEHRRKLPVGPWPKDRKLKEIGEFNLVSCETGLEGFAIYVGTQVLKWSVEETQMLILRARKALRDKSIHAWYPVSAHFAQKPPA